MINVLNHDCVLKSEILELLLNKQMSKATEKMADAFKSLNYIYTTRHDEKPEVWIYNEGIYIPEGKCFIREFCRNVLGIGFTEYISNQVISKIMTDTYIDIESFFKNNIVEEIVVKNGLLNLRNRELKPFDPSKVHFTKIPVFYNPEATCPNIEAFFKDVLETPEDIETMFELFGFCLWKDNFMETGVMMLGAGRNGKSKTLELLRRFLGEENTKSIPLQKLEEDNFSESELFGKLANLAGDLSDKPLDITGKYKALTGRDSLSASRKFKTKIDFVSFAKPIFATNKLPKVKDNTIAFWERWVFFMFPYTFEPQEQLDRLKNSLPSEEYAKFKLRNPEIISMLATDEELSGLLNRSIDGLHSLIVVRQFTQSRSAEEIRMLWIRSSDSFLAYCLENLEQSPECSVPKDFLRKNYQNYCKKNKSIPEGDKHIKSILSRQFGCMEGREPDELRRMTWEGIDFKEGQKKVV